MVDKYTKVYQFIFPNKKFRFTHHAVETKLPSSRRVSSIMVNESGLPLTAMPCTTHVW